MARIKTEKNISRKDVIVSKAAVTVDGAHVLEVQIKFIFISEYFNLTTNSSVAVIVRTPIHFNCEMNIYIHVLLHYWFY